MQQNRPILLFDDILSLNNDNLAEKWSRWLNDYEKFAESNGILDQTDPKLIISSLLFYAGPNLTGIYDEYLHPDDNYEMVKDKIQAHFKPIIHNKNNNNNNLIEINKDSNNETINSEKIKKIIPLSKVIIPAASLTKQEQESSKQVT